MRKYIQLGILALSCGGMVSANERLGELGVQLFRQFLELSDVPVGCDDTREKRSQFIAPDVLEAAICANDGGSLFALDCLVWNSLLCDRFGRSLVDADERTRFFIADTYRIVLLRLLKSDRCPVWVKERVIALLDVQPGLDDYYVANTMSLLQAAGGQSTVGLVRLLMAARDWSLRSDLYSRIVELLSEPEVTTNHRQVIVYCLLCEVHREELPVGYRFCKSPADLEADLYTQFPDLLTDF